MVEVMGAFCGYLALNAALGAGAETVYLPEEGVTIDRLKQNSNELIERYLAHDLKYLQLLSHCCSRFVHKDKSMAGGMGLIIVNEKVNKIYNTNFISSLFEAEGLPPSSTQEENMLMDGTKFAGKGSFSVRKAVLGHLQQGGDPSPIDRIRYRRLLLSGSPPQLMFLGPSAVRMAAQAITFISQKYAKADPSAPAPR